MVLKRDGKQFLTVANWAEGAEPDSFQVPARLLLEALTPNVLQMNRQTVTPMELGRPLKWQTLTWAQRQLFVALDAQLTHCTPNCLAAIVSRLSRDGDMVFLFINRRPLPGRTTLELFSEYCIEFLANASETVAMYVRDTLAATKEMEATRRLRNSHATHAHKMNQAFQSLYCRFSKVTRLMGQIDQNQGRKEEILAETVHIKRTLERMQQQSRVVEMVVRAKEKGERIEVAHKTPRRISVIISNCVEEYEELAQSEGSPFKTSFGKEDPFVECDEALITIMVVNIIDNAVKYSFIGEPVDLKLMADQKEVRFKVTNYGVGVPQGMEERIFELYWRAEVPYGKKAVVGSGIGLNVAKLICEAHGGSITYESIPAQPSEKYRGAYTEEDIKKGFCYTTVVTVVLPRMEGRYVQ